MSRTTKLETRDDVVDYLVDQESRSKDQRFILARGCGWGQDGWVYRLELAGTGTRMRSNRTVLIPAAVGEVLADKWSTNDNGRFVGARGAVRILTDMGVPDAATQAAAVRADREHRMMVTRRGNIRDTLRRKTSGEVIQESGLLRACRRALEIDALGDPDAIAAAQAIVDAAAVIADHLADEEE